MNIIEEMIKKASRLTAAELSWRHLEKRLEPSVGKVAIDQWFIDCDLCIDQRTIYNSDKWDLKRGNKECA